MRNLDVNIGRRCNLRCSFCLDGGRPPEQRQWVPLERAREEVRRGHDQGCRALGLLGGEPTVYPALFALLDYARGLGFERMALYTNGVALADADLVDRLLASGITRIGVSVHGHTAALEDGLTGRKGGFARKTAGLRHLAARRRRGALPDGLAVNPVIVKPNVAHLGAMTAFFARLGVSDLRFNFVRAIGRAQGSRALTPRYRDAARAAVELIVATEARRLRARPGSAPALTLTFGDFPYCLWPWEILGSPVLRQRYIGELHDLRTDVALISAPLAPDEDLQRFNWADRRRAELKLKFPQCQGCAFEAHCEGVYRCYVELYGDREFGAVDAQGRRIKRRP